jgi:4-oxalocrotonate tautomerase
MPLLQLRLGTAPNAELAERAAALLLDHTTTLLGKPPGVTAIQVDFVNPATWFVAGRSLASWGQASYSLAITITDETNTKAEKARYLQAVHAGLRQLLGPLHEESYIHVHDVRAAAYGWGGQTQEWRYHHP